ncbi:F-box domain containing protein, partial [Tanacetum coccineum]
MHRHLKVGQHQFEENLVDEDEILDLGNDGEKGNHALDDDNTQSPHSLLITKNVSFTMKKIGKPDEFGDSSSFSYLLDEIVLQILSRLIDLKTLCRCKLVSIRFNHIVQQVDAISSTIISVDHPSFNSNSLGAPGEHDDLLYLFKCESFHSFVSVMKSLKTFSALKSLCIEIPSFHKSAYNCFLFKWKLLSNTTDSFLFLSPNSVCDTKENVQDEEEEEEEYLLSEMKLLIAMDC